ncbi:mariner transposase [Trichonephila clavipes]|nr:mariner transposase [Trichonephila clavipes]
MESDKQHFRHILLFYYRKGKNAVQARKKLTDVYGGRPIEAAKDAIKALVDANRRITTSEIGFRLNLSNSKVYDHLKGLGLPSKLDVWDRNVLAEKNLCLSIDVCDSLIKRQENYPFLKRIISGEEKGHGAKKDESAQTISKADIHQKRTFNSVRNRCLHLATGRTRDDIERRIWQRQRRKGGNGEEKERGCEETGGREK